ncbi:MAG: VTT domain-containing protein [Gemmatimonadota bacterium]
MERSDGAGRDVTSAPGGDPPQPIAQPDVPLPGFLRRLYDWVLGWANTRYGRVALVALCFAEASFFPIPPDPLLMALALGAPRRAFSFAAWATAASVAGGVAGYLIGWGAWSMLGDFFFSWVPGVTPESFDRVQGLYDRYDFFAIFLAGLTPIPYKVITLSAGVFSVSFPVFVVASVLSRGLRFFAVAALLWKFGAPVSRFIDRYFNVLTLVFGILLVLGFVVIARFL